MMQVYIKGKLIEGVTQVEMLKSGVVSVETIARDDEGNHLTDEASLVLNVNHYPIRDVRFGEGMVTEHHMGATKPMKTCNDAPVGYTDHPPVGEWVEWYGGDCPVHPLATLDYQVRNGQRCVDTADQLDWSIQGDEWDVVRFCILEEYKPEAEKVAREVWVMTDEAGYDYFCGDGDYGATLFREVLE